MAERSGQNWFSADNISATSSAFTLEGGLFGVMVEGDFSGGGSVTLQGAAKSGTYVTVLTAFSADGYATVYLPGGQYKFTVGGTVAAVYATISPIPLGKRTG